MKGLESSNGYFEQVTCHLESLCLFLITKYIYGLDASLFSKTCLTFLSQYIMELSPSLARLRGKTSDNFPKILQPQKPPKEGYEDIFHY